jgi:hypothetical protein
MTRTAMLSPGMPSSGRIEAQGADEFVPLTAELLHRHQIILGNAQRVAQRLAGRRSAAPGSDARS